MISGKLAVASAAAAGINEAARRGTQQAGLRKGDMGELRELDHPQVAHTYIQTQTEEPAANLALSLCPPRPPPYRSPPPANTRLRSSLHMPLLAKFLDTYVSPAPSQALSPLPACVPVS